MGIRQDLFEYGEQLGYYQILKGSLITFTEKMTLNHLFHFAYYKRHFSILKKLYFSSCQIISSKIGLLCLGYKYNMHLLFLFRLRVEIMTLI